MDGEDVEFLKTEAVIAFDGNIRNGLHVHPDMQHIVYAFGSKVTILNWFTKEQHFLSGHTNTISSLALSNTGKYIGSGQINHMGFRAFVILWDFDTREILAKSELHKVRVEFIAFSSNNRYMFTLGGRDCGDISVWDILNNEPLCSSQAARNIQGDAMAVCATNKRGQCCITVGDGTLRAWSVYQDQRRMAAVDVNVGKLKRCFICIVINNRDEFAYCGTTTGDIVKIRLNYHHDMEVLEPDKPPVLMACIGKWKESGKKGNNVVRYSLGVTALLLLENELLVVGGGDGTVDLVSEREISVKKVAGQLSQPTHPMLQLIKTTSIFSGVTSLHKFGDKILCGSQDCEIFTIDLETFDVKMWVTCHTATIFEVAFPNNYSDVFATASKDDVRVWSVKMKQEMLRIRVPNFYCSGLKFANDGKSLVTGWNDGLIRAFTPVSGRLMYAIPNAHSKGVSCIAITNDGKRIVSGGCEGQVRLWALRPAVQSLEAVLKEHTGPVTSICVNCFDTEAATSSTDGTCIIWDLERLCRKQLMFGNTLFMCIRYYPTGVQLLTCGSDRRICYWEVLDGSLVRELEGSTGGTLNSLSISGNGALFATGSNDQIVKLWDYMEGTCKYIGVGHSAAITAVAMAPNGKHIVSCCGAGTVFIWKVPKCMRDLGKPISYHAVRGNGTKNRIRWCKREESQLTLNFISRMYVQPGLSQAFDTESVKSLTKSRKCEESEEDVHQVETARSKSSIHVCPCVCEVKPCGCKARVVRETIDGGSVKGSVKGSKGSSSSNSKTSSRSFTKCPSKAGSNTRLENSPCPPKVGSRSRAPSVGSRK